MDIPKKKINLEEILNKNFNLYTAYSVKDKNGEFTPVIDKAGALKAMKEACKQTLELAVENAKCNAYLNYNDPYDYSQGVKRAVGYVDEQSIIAVPLFDYIKCPLSKWTFSIKPIREWTEKTCEGKTLNLFAGRTKLNIDEVRNDLDDEALADYQKDALQFVKEWNGEKFDTILLDPPYAYRKSMEMYKGIKASPFRQLKDELPRILKPNGLVITFGYHSNTMGKNRGFEVEQIALFSHGGAIHDTIASVERHCR